MRRAGLVGVVIAVGIAHADVTDDPLLHHPSQAASIYGRRPPALRARVTVDEPSFPIARAYGAVRWTAACESRGSVRTEGDADELAAYLQAWCSGSHERALAELAALTGAHTRGLADAVHQDVLALLADTRDAPAAMAWMTEHLVVRDGALADVYIALDRPGEASTIVAAGLGEDDHARCLQLGRQVYDGNDAVAREEVLRMAARGDDKDCKQIAAYIRCPPVWKRGPLGFGHPEEIAYDIQACAPLQPEIDVAAATLIEQWPIPSFAYTQWSWEWSVYATDIAQLDPGTLRNPDVVAIALDAYDTVATVCDAPITKHDIERLLASPADPAHPEAALADAMRAIPKIADACELKFARWRPVIITKP